MSRRCKPGQRARYIAGWNKGTIVVVVRQYLGEDIDGTWPLVLFPWVVASLGVPIRRICLHTGRETPAKMMAVADDRELQPLDDDDDGLTESTEKDKPAGELR